MQGGKEHWGSQNNSLIPGRPGQPPGQPLGRPGDQIRRTVEEEALLSVGNVGRLPTLLLLLVKVLEMS